MKNITVTVHDGIYIQARVWAAQNGTSVSYLVRKFLETLHDDSYPDRNFHGKSVPPSPPPHVRL